MLDQIINWRVCNADIPDGYEAAAVANAVIDMWDDFLCVEATAKHGVAGFDREIIAVIIAAHSLSCTVDEVAQALLAECRARVEAEQGKEEE